MHPIIYYIFFFLAVGAIGMALGSRKADRVVKRRRWLKYFTYILFTGIVILGMFYGFFQWVAAAIVLGGLAELIKVNYSRTPASTSQAVLSLVVYGAIATGFLLFAHTFRYSFLLFIYFQLLVFDGFCQISGQLFGKHSLAPAISPTKTWEGLIGGWVCCILTAMTMANWDALSVAEAALYGWLSGLFGFYGDLLASWYKRKTGVKDYSNWLPGQGGFLDRFDSFLFSGAIYYLLYIVIFKSSLIA